MKVILRLYRQHDLDLIALHRHKNFSLTNAMKMALGAYVRKENLKIKTPEPTNSLGNKPLKTATLFLVLDEHEDNDIIEWIQNVKPGYRNSVIKNLTREYLTCPTVYIYQQDEQKAIKEAVENAEIFENVNTETSVSITKSKKKSNTYNNTKREKSRQNDENVFTKIMREEKVSDERYIENLEKETKKELTLEEVFNKIDEKEKREGDIGSDMMDAFEDMMNQF